MLNFLKNIFKVVKKVDKQDIKDLYENIVDTAEIIKKALSEIKETRKEIQEFIENLKK